MKLRMVWLGLAAFVLGLLWVLPMRWVAGLLPSQVQCRAWSGSLWQGQCSGLAIQQGGPAIQVDTLQWKLHPLALLRLAISADFSFRNSQGSGSGVAELGRNGRIVLDRLAINAVLDRRLATMLAEGWNGQLETRQLKLGLQGDSLQQLSGEVFLRDFNDGKGASFGSYRLVFAGTGTPPFTGRLADAGGPLETAATLTISADRRWQLDGLITPRPDASRQLRAGLELLSAPDASGRHRIQSEGIFR